MWAYLPDGLEHAAHPSHEEDLLLEDLATLAFGFGYLCLLVLLHLLLLQDGLHVFVFYRFA